MARQVDPHECGSIRARWRCSTKRGTESSGSCRTKTLERLCRVFDFRPGVGYFTSSRTQDRRRKLPAPNCAVDRATCPGQFHPSTSLQTTSRPALRAVLDRVKGRAPGDLRVYAEQSGARRLNCRSWGRRHLECDISRTLPFSCEARGRADRQQVVVSTSGRYRPLGARPGPCTAATAAGVIEARNGFAHTYSPMGTLEPPSVRHCRPATPRIVGIGALQAACGLEQVLAHVCRRAVAWPTS